MSDAINKFKEQCQQHFDKAYPQALAIIEERTGEPYNGKPCQLRFADLGYKGGTYAPNYREGKYYHFIPTVTVNAQLINHTEHVLPVIRHELAHFIAETIKTEQKITATRGKWGAHGAVWKEVAVQMGDSGDRCHNIHSFNPAKFKVQFIQEVEGRTRTVWQTHKRDIQNLLADPSVLSVEVKDDDGFWVPAEAQSMTDAVEELIQLARKKTPR